MAENVNVITPCVAIKHEKSTGAKKYVCAQD